MHLNPSLFHVSTTTGFLLESPLETLPPYFESWAEILKSMPMLLSENQLRNRIAQLPLLDADRLVGHRQYRLAHSQLGTLVSGYVWCQGDQQVPKILPKNLAVPYFKVNKKLGLKPGISPHVGTVLCNYKLKEPHLELKCENMEMLNFKFVEDFGNDWFFLATAQVELEFAAGVMPLKNAVVKNIPTLIHSLLELRNVIENMEIALGKMSNHLKPDVFFHQFRPYLAGTTGGKYDEWGGIILEDVSQQPFVLIGGSAAQAAPIQCLDALLQIEHETKSREFLCDMRHYILPHHRQFIEEIEKMSRVREVVIENSTIWPDLKNAFDDCVQALVSFRNRHIQIVTKFILAPKSKQNAMIKAAALNDGPKNQRSYTSLDEIGTGGTGIMPFLKTVRDSTKECVLE